MTNIGYFEAESKRNGPVAGISKLRMFFAFLLAGCALVAENGNATEPDEVLVVVNKRMPGAVDIAKYYMRVRHIPEDNFLVTSLTTSEEIKRNDYESKIKKPVVAKIEKLKQRKIYTVVLVYGIPLRIMPPALNREKRQQLEELKAEQQYLQNSGGKSEERDQRLQELRALIESIRGSSMKAAVDSELALAKVESYPLRGWVRNPYFIPFQADQGTISKSDVLSVARLDGPDAKTVRRMIDDSLAAEKTGLKGTAYFDARWPLEKNDKLQGYKLYDASIHAAAKVVEKRLPVKLDAKPELFGPGAAPQAALYTGWYSLARYVDSFEWVKGSVGFHIASSECTTLKDQKSQVWCLQMLKRGAAATLGPVAEPYVQGFPLPEIFFAAFTEGYMNLGESYLVSLPFLSWQMVLVGDPLYKPFTPIAK